MQIIKKVQVKQIVTERSKNNLKNHFLHQKMRLEQECQQLLFEQRKMQSKAGMRKHDVKNRFEKEINQRKSQVNTFDFKLEQLEILELGSEIIEKEVEALVEVREGLHWDEVMKEQAIIIKDDIIIRIDH